MDDVKPSGRAQSEASEDATGDTDTEFDPLFDDNDNDSVGGDQPKPPPPQQPALPSNQPNGNGMLRLPGPTGPPMHAVSPTSYPVRGGGNAPGLSGTGSKKETSHLDPATYADFSSDILMTAGIDGQILLWDRRADGTNRRGVGKLEANEKTPPWCVSVSQMRFLCLCYGHQANGISWCRHAGPLMARRFLPVVGMGRSMFGMSENSVGVRQEASPRCSRRSGILRVVGV